MEMIKEGNYKQAILEYYDVCWLERFKEGHNPNSLAMHMGYFNHNDEDNDIAKLQMNSLIASKLGLTKDSVQTIMDAGCGIGGSLFYLNRQFPHINLIGVNISNSQISFARQVSEAAKNITFLEEDYTSTSLKSNSVDIVYAIESVCHSESKEGFFEEAYRVLKPGGRLLVVDYIQTCLSMDSFTISALEEFQKGWAVNGYIHKPEEKLTQSGFIQVEVESILDFVLPGIEKSYQGSQKKIALMKSDENPLLEKHYRACVSLKLLVEKGVIDYCVLQCVKPMK